MTTKQDLIEKITQKCIVANPEIMIVKITINGKPRRIKSEVPRDITLADVLMAIDEVTKDTMCEVEITSWGMFCGSNYDSEKEPIIWNLKEPLQNQSEETLTFIHSLLYS